MESSVMMEHDGRIGASGWCMRAAQSDMQVDRTSKIEQQHLRLLDGLAASIREKGLPQTHVSDIVRQAHASRRTFYEHFPDKGSSVFELVQLNAANIIQAIALAIDLDATRSTQIE